MTFQKSSVLLSYTTWIFLIHVTAEDVLPTELVAKLHLVNFCDMRERLRPFYVQPQARLWRSPNGMFHEAVSVGDYSSSVIALPGTSHGIADVRVTTLSKQLRAHDGIPSAPHALAKSLRRVLRDLNICQIFSQDTCSYHAEEMFRIANSAIGQSLSETGDADEALGEQYPRMRAMRDVLEVLADFTGLILRSFPITITFSLDDLVPMYELKIDRPGTRFRWNVFGPPVEGYQ